MKRKIVILTGAGMSAESGLKTFRDANGLWEGHNVQDVASPEGWQRDKTLVLDFYNQRRAQLLKVKPNDGHLALVDLEKKYEVSIVTQNVDDLHERAGSSDIIHLHGELFKVRSIKNEKLVYDWTGPLVEGDVGKDGHQLRPHIVWFGEQVPMLDAGAAKVFEADIIIVIGTSMQVYPAASLVGLAQKSAAIYYIDPRPSLNYELKNANNLEVIEEVASTGVRKLVDKLMADN